MPFTENAVTIKTHDCDSWDLKADLVYIGKDQTFIVPAGFRTDFATVPKFMQWLVQSTGKWTLAAVLHDYLCTVGISTGQVTSRDTDGIFRRVMRELGVPVWTRWLMWTGVRWGAVANPKRRDGVYADLPVMLFISLLALPIVVPASVGVGFGLLLNKLYGKVSGG